VTAEAKRDRKSGQYAHSKFDELCVCGHTLGEHTAAVVGGLRPCVSGDFTGVNCDCQKFRKVRAVASKKPKQLNAEIASALTAGPQPELAALFADPASRRVFAEEMRLQLYKKKAAEDSAAHLAARPYTVRHWEGDHTTLFGRYATENEARAAANRAGGWVMLDNKVIYGERK
jgi:hypothetical protein